MAQTTRLASFGPVSVIRPLPSYCRSSFFIDYNLYIVVSNKQMRRNKKKTYYWPNRRQMRRLGPFSSSTPHTSLPVVYSVVYNRFTL